MLNRPDPDWSPEKASKLERDLKEFLENIPEIDEVWGLSYPETGKYVIGFLADGGDHFLQFVPDTPLNTATSVSMIIGWSATKVAFPDRIVENINVILGLTGVKPEGARHYEWSVTEEEMKRALHHPR